MREKKEMEEGEGKGREEEKEALLSASYVSGTVLNT